MNYTKWITRTGLLLALTLVIQMMGFPSVVTGPLVNMMLFTAVHLVGWLGASLIGGVTPWLALVRGILPPPLAPLIPFIIAGNIILVSAYYFMLGRNNYLGIGLAALLKFAILSSGVRFLVKLPPKVAQMMQMPQLLTALTGGFLALVLVKLLDRIFTKQNTG
ncbi:ECF transporter S component [Sporohalobacter salinus]|uniref:ECF transporter S component n=1 Tax=Sporohalobacter salinus TaxID=1494606 RepID=UPI00195F4AED|nr:ECF transporter S component [Sporohalobacter salinus]MBM7622848.1 putative YccA/Bax inhibitor family protein [Sporohalobacter salinus]